MFTRLKGSLFGRKTTMFKSKQSSNNELMTWARTEYPKDAQYAYHCLMHNKLSELKETYHR